MTTTRRTKISFEKHELTLISLQPGARFFCSECKEEIENRAIALDANLLPVPVESKPIDSTETAENSFGEQRKMEKDEMKKINIRLASFALVLTLSSQAALGVPTTLAHHQVDHIEKEVFVVTNKVATRSYASPDLRIRQFLFAPTDNKVVRVQVVNSGNAVASACRLVLTVRKLNGVAVGRQTHVNLPALAAGKTVWLNINAKSILPNNVSLESTTFKLNVDATEIVNELDENNNEIWHGLPATTAIGQGIGGLANDGGEDAPGKPETSDTQQLSGGPNEQKACVRVSGRWSVCGNTNFKNKFSSGVGISFNEIDPNGRVLVSRTYENCSKLAEDKTIPADLRKKAAGPCKQSLKLAVKEAAIQ